MHEQMNHQEAVELARKIDAKYELRVTIRDFESKDDPTLNYSYLGLWVNDILLFSLNGQEQWEAIRDFAYKMVQTDADLSQEEPIIENIKDTPGDVREMSETDDLLDFMARSLGEK